MEGLPTLGVEVVIVEGGRVLLMRRADFDIWGLPGGYVEPGESLAEAAIREAREETGLEIELVYLIGLYSYRRWLGRGYHFAAFLARPLSGGLRPQIEEGLELRYADPHHLPQPLGFGVEQVVADAVTGQRGFVRAHEGDLGADYADLLRQRHASGLSAREYYLTEVAPHLEPAKMSLDVGVPLTPLPPSPSSGEGDNAQRLTTRG